MLVGVVVLYLLGTLIAGALLSARIKRVSDYLVAGRELNLALSTASLAAVQIGAGVVLGGAENGASNGLWPGVWYGLGCGGGLILGGLLAAEKMRSMGGIVPIDFFSARYGEHRGVRTWAWLSNIPSLLGIFAAQMMASGSVLSGALGVSFQTAVLIVAGVIFVSNVLSGMWGVVFADFFQVSIIMIGIPITAIASACKMRAATLRDLAMGSTPMASTTARSPSSTISAAAMASPELSSSRATRTLPSAWRRTTDSSSSVSASGSASGETSSRSAHSRRERRRSAERPLRSWLRSSEYEEMAVAPTSVVSTSRASAIWCTPPAEVALSA